MKSIEVVCKRCGKKATFPRTSISNYCSQTCRSADQVRKVKVNCFFCNTEMLRTPSQLRHGARSYCSHVCAGKVNSSSRRPNPPKQRTCPRCAALYCNTAKRRSAYCEPCSKEVKEERRQRKAIEYTLETVSLSPSLKGRHPSWRNAQVRIHNRQNNKTLLQLPCQNCGYSKHVELCHIRGIASFPKSTPLSEVNRKENNLVLCRNCHWEFDHQKLLLEDIQKK